MKQKNDDMALMWPQRQESLKKFFLHKFFTSYLYNEHIKKGETNT